MPRKKQTVGRKIGRAAKAISRVERNLQKAAIHDGKELYKRGRLLGPGLIAGAADDDAGGIAAYSIVGATAGYALNWLMLLSTPMLIVVQSICGRLGAVTRKGIATLIKERYGKNAAIFAACVLAIANTGAIAANIAGMSVAVELVTGISWSIVAIPLSLILLYLVIFENFAKIQKALIYLSLVLVAYVVSGLLSHPDWLEVLKATFVPHIEFSLAFVTAALGLLGATIAPYLFFWQADSEIEAKRTAKQLGKVDFDIYTGMIYSNLVSYFIIISSAAVLFPRIGSIGSVSNAADPVRFIALALKPAAGDYSFYLFAIGLFAASTLALVVLASSTAYVVCETMGWRRGLNKKLGQAKGFYGTLAASIFAGGSLLYLGAKPFDAMYYSQVLAGLLDPILLVMIVKIASDPKIMGKFAITGWLKAIAWATIAIISAFVLLLLRGLLPGVH